MTSPSEKYARYQAEKRRLRTEFGAFTRRYDFELDPFQIDACESLEDGRSVLVAAPTGAGKTVVGEFAVHLALARGQKVFYTAPIKALSNQKHEELCAWLGHQRVGLLTGDTSIRPDAEVIVMTTEVLRNMLYADSPLLDGLGFVVMDEVHYLADRLRGPVWEEVIIHLDASVRLVALSATVSNAEEFGSWLNEVRGDTHVVVSETRPVPLWQHVMVADRLLDLFVDAEGNPTVSHGPGVHRRELGVNPDLQRAISATARFDGPRASGHGGGPGRGRHGGKSKKNRQGRSGTQGRHRSRGNVPDGPSGGGAPRTPRGIEVIRALDDEALLPAIYFIFSRAGCDASVRRLDRARLRLTTDEERRRIRSVLDERLAVIGHEDEELLQLERFRLAAENGYAAHHAGMLPLLKTCVEDLFAEALVKVVFATETLALGINMPARSVVLEKLTKFNGVEHADLTPGEYTQLTGRAGRRGIDTEGHAVVIASGGTDAEHVASLASRRTYPLRSAFRPTANMAVNLLARFDAARSRKTLEMSFAQFQTDRSVVGLARRASELEQTAESYGSALVCDRGDLWEYARLRRAIGEREKDLSRDRASNDRAGTRRTLRSLHRGDVLALPGGRRQGYAAVLDVDRDVLDGPQVHLLDTEGRLRSIRPGNVPSPPAVIDRMKIPARDRLRTTRVRKDTASALRQKLSGRADAGTEVRKHAPRTPSTAATDPQLRQLRAELAAHPCHDCPELEAHERWLSRYTRATKDLASVERRIEGRTASLARAFDALVALLTELGYLRPTGAGRDEGDAVEELEPTERGMLLRRVFSDRDLLIAECLDHGAWDGLDAPELVAIVSAAIYESRREDPHSPAQVPSASFDRALEATIRIGEELNAAQRRHRVEVTDPPDPAVAAIMYAWASGNHLAAAIGEADLTPGDFVRHCRQVIDLLEQLTDAPHVALTAGRAIVAVRRGLVAQEIDA